jgi:hypothetical protein
MTETFFDEEKCECGMQIPKGYGYYNYNKPLKCFGCGKINQKINKAQQIKEEPTNPPILNVETPKIKTPFCLFCRAELLPNPHGRKRLYCNDKCSMKYWIQNNKEKWSKSVRIASREYQRRKQKKIVENRNKQENILREEMQKDNVQNI